MQRHQWNFYSKCQKESPPQKQLTTRLKRRAPQQQIICCSSPTILQQKTGKHCQTSNHSIQYQQVSCTYFTSSTSSQSNKQKHRQLCTFVKHIKTQLIKTCETCKLKAFKSLQQSKKRLAMFVLCIPTTQNSQWHLYCSKQYHPKIQTILSKFLFHLEQAVPTCTKTYNLLKGFNCSWDKTRPQTHTQQQCQHTKKQCIKTMHFPFFSRQYTEKKCCSLGLLLNSSQQSFKRNRQQQNCSQHAHTKYLRPHFLF